MRVTARIAVFATSGVLAMAPFITIERSSALAAMALRCVIL